MRRFLFAPALVACAIAMLCGLAACGSRQDPSLAKPQWTYEPDAIKLRYKADPRLNEYDGEGHTVLLCIYQLTEPSGFNNLAKTEEGLRKLLECKNFDQTAVYYEKLYIEPGQDQIKYLDRAEKATYLGVAAGYNQLNPPQATKLFKYPVDEKTEGFFTTTVIRTPGKVFVNLFLGPFGVQKVGSQ